MPQPLPPPKKEGEITVYEIEVSVEDFEESIRVPLEDKKTRLVVRLRPPDPFFSV